MNDLFGNPVLESTMPQPSGAKKRRNETPRGYAAPPGTGPVGHYCKDCRHFVRKHMANTYFKCWLMQKTWTGGFKTDIRANSPACKHWASEVQKDKFWMPGKRNHL